jgi:hypothetical protein
MNNKVPPGSRSPYETVTEFDAALSEQEARIDGTSGINVGR